MAGNTVVSGREKSYGRRKRERESFFKVLYAKAEEQTSGRTKGENGAVIGPREPHGDCRRPSNVVESP